MKGTKSNSSKVREKMIYLYCSESLLTDLVNQPHVAFHCSLYQAHSHHTRSVKVADENFLRRLGRHLSHIINPLFVARRSCADENDTTPSTRLRPVYSLGRSQHTAHHPQHHVAQLREFTQNIS